MRNSSSSLENSRRSSRSPSPSPRNRQPVLRIQPMAAPRKQTNYPCWFNVLTSGWFYYTSLIFTFLLFITVGHFYLSINYCTGQEYIDCKPCPPNYKCDKKNKNCTGYDHNDVCIPYNSTDNLYEFYIKTKDTLEKLVRNGTVKTIEEIRELPPLEDDISFANHSNRNIVSLVSIIDGYTVKKGKIVKDIPESYRFHVVLSAYIISFICFLVSLYLRTNPPQF